MSELDQRMYDALQAENEKLIADNRKMKSDIEMLTEELNWFKVANRELENNNHVLRAQMDVVEMFLGKIDRGAKNDMWLSAKACRQGGD